MLRNPFTEDPAPWKPKAGPASVAWRAENVLSAKLPHCRDPQEPDPPREVWGNHFLLAKNGAQSWRSRVSVLLGVAEQWQGPLWGPP